MGLISRSEAADSLIYSFLAMRTKVKKAMTRDDEDVVKLHATPDAIVTNRNVRYGIFYGTYPQGLVRSLTAKSRKVALLKLPEDMTARAATTEAAWCMVPMRFVVVPKNDLGEVSP